MALKFNFFIILILSNGIHGIPEPCFRSKIRNGTIGNMCNGSIGKELETNGDVSRNSVLLRLTQHQQNCICNITIKNQLTTEKLTFRKHYGLNQATPSNDNCGLAVDISYHPPGPAIKPIQCSQNIPTNIRLHKDSFLQLKSRFIEGNFTRGYSIPSPDTNLSLEIRCDDFQVTTKHITTTNPPTSSTPVTTEKTKAKGPKITIGNQSSSEIPEPCLRSVIKNSMIGTMCRASIGKEAPQDGSIENDSVYLRIVTRQENCICTVSIKNQVNTESIIMRKQHGRASAAPTEDKCGLAADISYYPTGLKTITPIECTEPNKPLILRLLKGKTVKLQSRLIDGNFDRGYCMQFIRLQTNKTVDTNLLLQIKCDEPTLTAKTTKSSSITSGSPQASERATTQGPLTEQTTTEASTHVLTNEGKEVKLYIIGICVAVVLLALVLFIIVRHVRKQNRSEHNIYATSHTDGSDHVYDGLSPDTGRVSSADTDVNVVYYNDVRCGQQRVTKQTTMCHVSDNDYVNTTM